MYMLKPVEFQKLQKIIDRRGAGGEPLVERSHYSRVYSLCNVSRETDQ